jgi:TM2 domain-containing membrane protein YozV
MHCASCGKEIADDAVVCVGCGRAVVPFVVSQSAYCSPEVADFASKKTAAGVCGILLGSLGVHKFILGMTTPGIIMLLVSVLSCGILAVVMHTIGLVEGIIYLTKSDSEFYQQYAVEKKGWF